MWLVRGAARGTPQLSQPFSQLLRQLTLQPDAMEDLHPCMSPRLTATMGLWGRFLLAPERTLLPRHRYDGCVCTMDFFAPSLRMLSVQDGRTALHVAALSGSAAVVRRLLAHPRTAPNAVDSVSLSLSKRV